MNLNNARFVGIFSPYKSICKKQKKHCNSTKNKFFIGLKLGLGYSLRTKNRLSVVIKNNNNSNPNVDNKLFTRKRWEEWVAEMEADAIKKEKWQQSVRGQIFMFNYRIIMNFVTNLANLIIIFIVLFLLLVDNVKQFLINWKDCLEQFIIVVVKLICTGLWLLFVYTIVEKILVPNINFVFIHLLVDPIISFTTTIIKNKITVYFTIEKAVPYLIVGTLIAFGSRPNFIQANASPPNS